MNGNFIIPLNGLTAGENVFSWQIDAEFFKGFENVDILDACLDVRVCVEKSGRYVGVDCDVDGEVTVECDRCLQELVLPVDVAVRLSVQYGTDDVSDDGLGVGREIILVRDDESELDMSQIIYDYVCISLPMQRVHDEGDCDPAVMQYYEQVAEHEDADSGNPFSALKNMFEE